MTLTIPGSAQDTLMLVLVAGSLRVSKGVIPAASQEMGYRGHGGVLTLGTCYLSFALLGQLEKIEIP